MGYLKIVALQINLGIYVVELLLFSPFHFMGFFKDLLVSFLSYIYFFLFIRPESIFISMILIQMYSRQHRFLLVCNTYTLAMSSTSGNSENLADCGLQKGRSDFLG